MSVEVERVDNSTKEMNIITKTMTYTYTYISK